MFEKSDNYCLEDRESHRADKSDSEMHNLVWSEAAKLRTEGKLLEVFQKIDSKIYLIQGHNDPHPAKGVMIPLQEIMFRVRRMYYKNAIIVPLWKNMRRMSFIIF